MSKIAQFSPIYQNPSKALIGNEIISTVGTNTIFGRPRAKIEGPPRATGSNFSAEERAKLLFRQLASPRKVRGQSSGAREAPFFGPIRSAKQRPGGYEIEDG